MTEKTILITGASKGIGKSTAELFIESGWRVGLLARNGDALEAMTGGNENVLALPCDVTDADAVDAAVGAMVDQWGRLDALFNNAGMSLPGAPIDEIDVDDWLALSNVNINGMFICARAAFGQMRRQDPQGGRIINNGSISAQVPRPGSVPYTMSKHAVTGLTRTLSLDGRPFDIACGQVDIGNALTDMAVKMTQGVPQADGTNKVEPVMDVRDVARGVFQMASFPPETNVQFMTIMATKMPFIGRG